MLMLPISLERTYLGKMRTVFHSNFFGRIAIAFLVIFICKVQAQQNPNIVFFLADDCTKWDLGCYGSPDAKTPTIDSLASQGMKFSQCYQQAPMCSPTRHSIHTGMYPVRSGAYPNHTFAESGTKSVSHYLIPRGYRVVMSGKRHILPREVFNYEYLDGSDTGETDPDFSKVDAFLSDAKTRKDKFCLFVCSHQPHSPWNQGNQSLFDPDKITLPPNLANTPATRTSFRNYLAEINYLDGQVKQTLALLRKHSLAQNTVFFFASEQGNSFPFAKWTCYNAGLSSGLIVNWPGVIKPATTCDALVEYVDLLPTFIDLAGGDSVPELDGYSMLPLLKETRKTHKQYTYGLQTTRGIFSGSDYFPIRTVADGTYRLILNLAPDMTFRNTVTESDPFFKEWLNSADPAFNKLADRYMHRPAIELYNDDTDPYNMTNLAADPQYRAKIAELQEKLLSWMAYCGDLGMDTELKAFQHQRDNIGKDTVAEGLLFYFPFDSSLTDSTAHRYTLQAPGGSSYAAGKCGQAVALNGSGQYLDLTVNSILNPARKPFTMCAWVYNSSTVTAPAAEHLENILAQTDGASDNAGRIFVSTSVNSSDTTSFRSLVGGSPVLSSPGAFKRNAWTHLAVVGDPINKTIAFYVDGVKDTTRPTSGAFEACTGGFRIGAHKNGTQNFWTGKIDELCLFKGILTKDEINRVKNNAWFDVTSVFDSRDRTGEKNSAAGRLSIKLEAGSSLLELNSENRIHSISIYSVSGQRLLSTKNTRRVNIRTLPAGTYIVRVGFGGDMRSDVRFVNQLFVRN
jgi:uncharacterized sulfatase